MTTTHQPDLGPLFDPATRPNPYPVFATLRDAGPFSLLDGDLTVTGEHARCSAMLRDPSLSSERWRSRMARRRGLDEGERRPASFLSLDPPDHTRLRRLVSKAFTPKVIAALEPRVRAVVDELFAAFAGSGRVDIVPALAYPLPVRIICELLGVPDSEHASFEDWSRRLVRGLDPALAVTDPAEAESILTAQQELSAYFVDLIARRRAEADGDDLLSRLVRIEEQGDQLSGDELVATCILLLVAGHETTANLIANGVVALLRNPDQLAALRADPGLVGGAVDEVLRYDPPVQLTTRMAQEPLTVGDVEVPPEGMVLMLLAAANRDPAVFDDPDRFDITRDARAHLSFAAGAHFCLGAGLARLEASVALSAFATRLADPVLDESALAYRPHVNLRGPSALLVDFS